MLVVLVLVVGKCEQSQIIIEVDLLQCVDCEVKWIGNSR